MPSWFFKRKFKIVAVATAAFATCGFLICWILLAYGVYAHSHNQIPNERLILRLCPFSIITLGLDNASLGVGLLGWLLIALMNAVTYAIPGCVIGVLIAVTSKTDYGDVK
jgi:hypothetical protein